MEPWSRILAKRPVRGALIATGALASIILIPFASSGAILGGQALLDGYIDLGTVRATMLGVGGLFGVLAAWVRVLAEDRKLTDVPWLWWAVLLGLLCGNVSAVVVLSAADHGFVIGLFVVAIAIGVFLMGATIGARTNAI
jgi:hypothetical protein